MPAESFLNLSWTSLGPSMLIGRRFPLSTLVIAAKASGPCAVPDVQR